MRFFQPLAHRLVADSLVADRRDQAQFHGLVGQQAQGPAPVPGGGARGGRAYRLAPAAPRVAGHRSGGAIDAGARATTRGLGQRRLPAALLVALAHLAARLPTAPHRLGRLVLALAGSQRQQGLRAAHGPHRSAARARDRFEGRLIGGR